ncbi:MAG: hypothetical protein ACJAYR_003495 [Sneathiella sp.]|jgi:hypothetical protein
MAQSQKYYLNDVLYLGNANANVSTFEARASEPAMSV